MEDRPASYADLKVLETNGKLHPTDYGTVRNIVSKLMKDGRVERTNSKATFLALKGVKFGKQKKQDLEMKKLSRSIQSLPESNRGLHDIHLRFSILDAWKIIFDSGKFKIVQNSADILLPPFTTNGMKIKVSIHRTDTVTVSVACSNNPVHVSVIEDVEGVIRLAKALAKTELFISRTLDECGQMVPGGYERIPIPDSDSWIVTMCHFGVDSPHYLELNNYVTWKDGQAVLLREYKKKKNILRRERQEYPKIPFAEVRKKIFDSNPVDERDMLERSEDTQEKSKNI